MTLPEVPSQQQEEERELLSWLLSSSSSTSATRSSWEPGELARATPLQELHASASAVHRHQDAILRRSRPQNQQEELLPHAQSTLRAYVLAVERQGCFSRNEEADDLVTSQLKHLMAPFYLAELLTSSPAALPAPSGSNGEPGEAQQRRARLVAESARQYSAFLQRLEQYGLLDEVAKQQQAADEDNQPDESSEGARLPARVDPTAKRAAKIERFKADKRLKAQLSLLEEQRKRALATHSLKQRRDEDSEGGADQNHEADGEQASSGPLGGALGWDEEDERRLWVTVLQQAALQALGQREMLREEAALLAQHAQHARQQAGRSGDARVAAARQAEVEQARQQEQQAEVLTQLRKIALDLGTKRQQLQAQVFQPGFLPPTRTLAEQAEIELEDARRREQAEQAGREAERQRKAELGSDEDEEELRKQRAWDDWKDANPVGWGNSKTKPCG